MALPICHAGMEPEKGGDAAPHPAAKLEEGGLCPSLPFSGVSQSKMIQAR